MRENIDDVLSKYELKAGKHKSIKQGACIMELVSYIANEPWSDRPECACQILTEYAIRINDRFSDEHRQLLKPLIPLLLNSKASDEIAIARKRLIMWRNVTVAYPLILEAYKLSELAEELRKFKNTEDDMLEAREFLVANKTKIDANAYAYAYANAYANANANAYAYANADADANANAYAYANADADADANAYAYANADADANADEFRDQIAAIAIETLRMACGVK